MRHLRDLRHARRLIPLSIIGALATRSPTARADDGGPRVGPLYWDPAWSHAGAPDYGLSIFGVEDALAYELFVQPTRPPLHWTGPILFDKAVRSALRGSTPGTRSNAATASWIGFGVVAAYPLLDVPYAWVRYGPSVAWDLFWQDATVLSLATSFDLNLRDLVGRARPPASDCLAAGGGKTCLTQSTETTRSFPGGHVLIVTSAAALTCTQHISMHLYGGPWDGIACASALTAATAVGTLRIVSDDHWATDIVAGSLLGVAFGWGIPVLMHFHGHAPSAGGRGAQLTPIPMPVNRGGGLGVAGWF